MLVMCAVKRGGGGGGWVHNFATVSNKIDAHLLLSDERITII